MTSKIIPTCVFVGEIQYNKAHPNFSITSQLITKVGWVRYIECACRSLLIRCLYARPLTLSGSSVTGQPVVPMPLHQSDSRLPVGVQRVGHFSDETTLLSMVAQCGQALPCTNRKLMVGLCS